MNRIKLFKTYNKALLFIQYMMFGYKSVYRIHREDKWWLAEDKRCIIIFHIQRDISPQHCVMCVLA